MKALRADDPRAIGGYQLLGTLGAGGMGQVYLARSRGGRTVAIKVIRPELADDPTFRVRFRREVEAARRVGGPWTAPVLDAEPDADRPYLVTGYVPGPSLLEAVRDRGPLPAPTVRALGAGLAEALVAVHGAGLVHRDLKPSNVLLSLDGPRVIDFGISRALDATALTHTGSAIGSPAFMSPEQINGAEVGPASDVFALGALLVYAATGSGPFGGTGMPAVMYSILSREPELGDLPADLHDLVRACLRKDPGARPGPADVLAALAPHGGAAGLVGTGWLPQDLVAGLSRRAVDLLELEVPAPPDDAATGGPGWSTAVTPLPGGRPVDLTPGTPTGPSGHGAAPSGHGAGPAGSAGHRRPLFAVAVAGTGVLGLAAAVALIVLLVVAPGTGREAAGGVADPPGVSPAATTGPLPATNPGSLIFPGASGGAARTVSPGGSASPGETAPAGGVGAPRPAPLPAGYPGTWAGRVTSRMGIVQEVVLTLRAGDSGQTLGHSEYTVVGLTDLGGALIRCVGDQMFVGVSDGPDGRADVVLRDIPGATENPTLLGLSMCSSGGTTRLRLEPDGVLALVSEDEAAGRPTGTLRRRT